MNEKASLALRQSLRIIRREKDVHQARIAHIADHAEAGLISGIPTLPLLARYAGHFFALFRMPTHRRQPKARTSPRPRASTHSKGTHHDPQEKDRGC